MIGKAFYLYPLESLKVVGMLVGILLGFAAILFSIFGFLTVKERAAESNSLVLQKYRSYKSKICPAVDFE
jgi:hypothetical protein